ncbi:hypothetical protein F3Y22_tig00001478pilonHSYRG00086 [Hibiscus syriacus]|uniref:Reverse transcriptase Ty1/copia-type domain-containing protein n=1 Tax=Hibiscus syriacus TaxID=106335 RepID=A0A6A3CV11_HIBSY|nr:hypothetical protein F3Y22_tig00001478pilonHSYRG00086 [Hibiscus syriacus]
MKSIDFTHPLYLHPTDTLGTVLVSHQLTGIDNYNLWSRLIRITLLWDWCNAIVLSWILNTVSADLSAGLVFASTVALVWKDLKECFRKIDGSQIFFLHREISLFTQGDSSVSTYYSRLKLLWDEYSALVLVSSCNCVDSSQALNHVLQQRIFQLNGFPLEFKFTKKKKTSSAMVANSDQNDNHSESYPLTTPLAPVFTTDQYNRLLELLNKDVHDSGDAVAANFDLSSRCWGLVFGCLGYATQTKPRDKGVQFHEYSFPFHSPELSSSVSAPMSLTLVSSRSSNVHVDHVIRRSSRVSKPPLWLNNSIVKPTSYSDAIKDPLWVTVTQEEIQALELNNTWCVVPLPPGKVPIGCKWMYKVKFRSNGEVECYKTHLVAKGYNQREGVDFVETFLSIAKLVTVRTVLVLTSLQHWSLFQMDVYNAFLQGNFLEEVYMQLPQGFCSQGENMVCRLQKSIYGLKQASRQWNMRLTEALVAAGYIQKLIEETGLGGAKPICTPMKQNVKLTSTGYDSGLIENGEKIIDDEVL